MINNELTNKIKYYLLILFVVIQPILDIHYLYTEKVVNAVGFSPSTIIRMGIIGVLGILTLLTLKDKKMWIIASSYLALVAIFTVLHIMSTKDFFTLVPNDLNYSVVGEIFYVIRMIIPMAVIFVAINTEISTKDYENAIKIVLLIISLSIIVSNVFKFSLESYGKEIISGNIFDWFRNGYSKYNYIELASRGPFNSANQLSALLCLLLPTMFGIYTYDKSKLNLFTILATILSMIMIGTKVALYGAIGVVIVYVCVILIAKLMKTDVVVDKKIFAMVGLAVLLIGSLYSKSPSINRGNVESGYKADAIKKEIEEAKKDDDTKEEVKKEDKNDKKVKNKQEKSKKVKSKKDKKLELNTKQGMVEYVGDNFIEAKIKYDFITQNYPYQYDPEFWLEIMNLPLAQRTDYRLLELKMHQRVKSLNNKSRDNLFGIGFTRTEHLFTLERDFVYQYYSVGLLGAILFLGPYVLIILACIIRLLSKLKNGFSVKDAMICFGVLFILAVSVYSGNIMDALTITIILAFNLAKLLKDLILS